MAALHPTRLVAACLSLGDSPDPILDATITSTDCDWPRIFWSAGNHLVTPSLAGALTRKGLFDRLPTEVQDYLVGLQALNRERNQALYQALSAVVARLNDADIEPLLLKGAIALLTGQYPGASDRVLGDLDLLVPGDRLDEASALAQTIGYRKAELPMVFPGDQDRMQHAVPLLHPTLPVTLEIHRRMLNNPEDNSRLESGLKARRLMLEGVGRVQVPDTGTRILHNFLHAQIQDQQRRRRVLNLRQLYEFAALAKQHADTLDWPSIMNRLRGGHRQAFAEYLGQAESWLGLPYPRTAMRAPSTPRELWLIEQVERHDVLRRAFAVYSEALRMPRRLARLPLRLVHTPGWFPAKFRALRQTRS
ncbi:nucleotidyltransferase family protein [Thiocapsa marina]|uniref:Nucleotidyltransferase family protein n=1 Tax=Thiocapsa marina 5811 TaxID=768671 RepID=F9UIX3_9GAMM|nr:nucleotidyltransferase family protein [Thiocapsa marina]EGV15851.1 hypothetical protein ThimaDRAFT_4876 [Thiocapsa marina 5811]